MRLVFFLLFVSLSAFAQHQDQPLKESDSDLRTGIIMFSIDDLGEDTIYWLERTPNLDYFLRMKEDDDDETIRKVDSRDAKKMEMDFASRFLKIQYEIESEKGDCKVTLRLTLKGESYDICKKDEKKAQEFAPFLQALSKRF